MSFYLRYSGSHRDRQEILAERGVSVDHATLNRWVVRYSPQIAAQAQMRKQLTPVPGAWMRPLRRFVAAGCTCKGRSSVMVKPVTSCCQRVGIWPQHARFFKKAIATNGIPDKIVIDKSGANLAGIQAVNAILKFTGTGKIITIRQVKYLNNIVEQDHRFIKRLINPMMGFKAFHSAAATLSGIEVTHMIRKNQFKDGNQSPYRTFALARSIIVREYLDGCTLNETLQQSPRAIAHWENVTGACA